MGNLIISVFGLILFFIFFGLFRYLGKDISIYRKIGKYIAYFAFLFLVVIGIINYVNEKPYIQEISINNYEVLVTFPKKPQSYDLEEGIKGFKTTINGEEYNLVYIKIDTNNSIEELTENFDKIIEEEELQVTHHTMGEIDSFYIVNSKGDNLYNYKKFLVYGKIFLDFNVKSKKQFPENQAEIFLDYKIIKK